MKVAEVLNEVEMPKKEKPTSIKYRVNGDGSHSVRIEYSPEKVVVHSNKKKEALEKIVRERHS